MSWTDDPVADAAAYTEEQDRRLARRPVCKCCGEHIQDDWAYYFDGDWICEDCMDDFRAYIDED